MSKLSNITIGAVAALMLAAAMAFCLALHDQINTLIASRLLTDMPSVVSFVIFASGSAGAYVVSRALPAQKG